MGKTPGSGRKKGSVNKITSAVKDMVLGALNRLGGEDYLVEQAKVNPVAFMSLLGRVIPTQISGDPANPLEIVNRIERVIIEDAADRDSESIPTTH